MANIKLESHIFPSLTDDTFLTNLLNR